MHTSVLRTESFRVEVDGEPATLEDVFPFWNRHDRVGVVMFSALAATGVGMLHQLAIAAFYEDRRASGILDHLEKTIPRFIWYPDYYLFHVNGRHGAFTAMDFLPPQKEVFVGDSGDELLHAINDRAITRLLVEERGSSDPRIESSALASASARICSSLVYSRTGRVAGADVTVSSTDIAEGNVEGVLDPDLLMDAYSRNEDPRVVEAMRLVRARRSEVSSRVRKSVAMERSKLLAGGRVIESYRRVPLEEAFRLLAHRP